MKDKVSKEKTPKTKAKKTKGFGLNISRILIMFAVIPMLLSALVLGFGSVNDSSKALKKSVNNSMVSIIDSIGIAFDNTTINSETTMINFIQSPVVLNVLKNPDDPAAVAAAQEYTTNFFGTLDGWEGIYIADWNSKVITHPAPPVVGKVMREGDRLKQLQDAMLAADKVYNVGIIESPASGQLIMSMYAPVFDENKNPIGYVGAGTFVNNVADKFADMTSLGLDSAYIYFVDAEANILYHPNEEKIGTVSENAAVKEVLDRMAAGEHPESACVSYTYNGKQKYCAYYVGAREAYVAVLTADETEVMGDIRSISMKVFLTAIFCVILFSILAMLLSRLVSKPLGEVSRVLGKLGAGDVSVKCNAKSHIKEVTGLITAFTDLKAALSGSMSNVKEAAKILSGAIISVDGKTSDNVDSISQINNAINEVASTSQSVAEEAQTMAMKAMDLGQEIENLDANVRNLYDGTLVIRNANVEATECMNSVYNGSMQSVSAVEDITSKINDTNAAVSNIESALQAIEAIAAQTNLLSLNASIEAARAGEAGRGFSIVAQEIRVLADSSAKSAQEIKEIVDKVIDLSNDTVKISGQVRDVINSQQTDIERAQEAFGKLSETVEASTQEINIIKDIASQMNGIKDDFAHSTSELGAISEELGASAEEVAASCQVVTDACNDTQASTEEMRAINENMSNAIDYFDLGDMQSE